MRQILFLVLTTVMVGLSANTQTLSDKDREFAINYLNETKQRLLDDVKGLSDAQLNWKPADSVWSVANCIEHISIVEKLLFDWSVNSLKEPANPEKRKEMKYTDEAIINLIKDRSFRVKAPEQIRPTGITPQQALKNFVEQRNITTEFVKTTKEDFRNHFVAHPVLGTIDTYQMLLFLTGHSLRHTLQVEELKARPDFPKS